MPIDAIDYFILERTAAGAGAPHPWPQQWIINEKTTTTGNPNGRFTIPPKTVTVTVVVADAGWIEIGEYVNIFSAGLFIVRGKQGNQLALEYLNENYNTHEGEVVYDGAQVLPGSFIDTAAPSPTYWYALTGKTINGITITYNVMSVTSSLPSPGALVWAIEEGYFHAETQQSYADSLLCVVGDISGNLYSGGFWRQSGNGSGWPALIKVNSAGGVDWRNRWAQGQGQSMAVLGVAVASDGHILHTGNYSDIGNFGGAPLPLANGSSNIYVCKTNKDTGAHIFSFGFGSSNSGTSEIPSGETGFAIKAAPDGGFVLIARYRGNMTVYGNNYATSQAVSGVTNKNNILVAKFNNAGDLSWARGCTSLSILGGASFSNNSPMDVAVDLSGNIYMTGQLGATNFGLGDFVSGTGGATSACFIVMFNSAGFPQWQQKFETGIEVGGAGIVVDNVGGAYVSGTFKCDSQFPTRNLGGFIKTAVGADGFSGDIDNFFMRINTSNGVTTWCEAWGTTGEDYVQYSPIPRVAIQGNNLLVVGKASRQGTMLIQDKSAYCSTFNPYAAKFSTAGVCSMLKIFSVADPGSSSGSAFGCAFDNSGNMILVGNFTGEWLVGTNEAGQPVIIRAQSSPTDTDGFMIKLRG